MKTMISAAMISLALAGSALAADVRPGVSFAGTPEAAGSPRAAMQNLMFDVASSWVNCDRDTMAKAVSDDVDFSYPTNRVTGRDAVLADLDAFCKSAKDTSIYFPADAFYIDEATGRIAAEVQFRTFQRGSRQVVNDVWVATVKDGKVAVIKEYLDGRVKDLQAQGVLQLEESPEFLTPWPPRTDQWKDCFPIVKAAPTNSCPAK
jgi:ketosteroid isomerase-like protein